MNKEYSKHLQTEMAIALKAQSKLKKQIAAVKEICWKRWQILTWNAKECKLFLQFKKLISSMAMSTKIDEFRHIVNWFSSVAHLHIHLMMKETMQSFRQCSILENFGVSESFFVDA